MCVCAHEIESEKERECLYVKERARKREIKRKQIESNEYHVDDFLQKSTRISGSFAKNDLEIDSNEYHVDARSNVRISECVYV